MSEIPPDHRASTRGSGDAGHSPGPGSWASRWKHPFQGGRPGRHVVKTSGVGHDDASPSRSTGATPHDVVALQEQAASQPAPAERPTWALRFLALLALLLAAGFTSMWVSASYYGAKPTEVMIFSVADGWCDPGSEAVGPHCFGDFSIVDDFFADDGDAWNRGGTLPPSNYPALAWYPALAAQWMGGLMGGGYAPLALYLALSVASLLAPAVWAGWGRWSTRMPLALALGGAATGPFLTTIDRGNSVALTVPPILLFAVNLMRRRYGWATAGLVVAALLKPQLALLGLLLLVDRRYRELALGAASTAILTLLAFAPFPHFPQNVLGWVRSLTAYTSVQSAGQGYPANLGLGRSLLTIADVAGVGPALGAERRASLVTWLDAHGTALNLTVILIAVAALWFGARGTARIYSLLLTLLVITFSSSTVYAYYTAVFLVVGALLLRAPTGSVGSPLSRWMGSLDVPAEARRSSALVAGTTVAAMAFTLAPIPLSAGLLGSRLVAWWSIPPGAGIQQHLIGPCLVLLLAVLVVHHVHAGGSLSTGARPEPRGAPALFHVLRGGRHPDA